MSVTVCIPPVSVSVPAFGYIVAVPQLPRSQGPIELVVQPSLAPKPAETPYPDWPLSEYENALTLPSMGPPPPLPPEPPEPPSPPIPPEPPEPPLPPVDGGWVPPEPPEPLGDWDPTPQPAARNRTASTVCARMYDLLSAFPRRCGEC